jgi:2-aminoethylphosphonate transport system ATP-binding protein
VHSPAAYEPGAAIGNQQPAQRHPDVHWQGDLTHLLCDVAGEAVRIVMTHVNPLPRAGDKLALYFEPNDAVLIEVQ